MKIFKSLIASIALSALSLSALAADFSVKSDSSSALTVVYGSARWVDLTPGAYTMTMSNGQSFSLRLAPADVSLMTQSSFFTSHFTLVSGNLYLNISDATMVWCSNGQTTIQAVGAGQVINDNCAAANAVYSVAK
jgi:hypothetical protein